MGIFDEIMIKIRLPSWNFISKRVFWANYW